MAREERIMKVLAGLYTSCVNLNLEKLGGVLRSDINDGIIKLKFSAHNVYQMGKDLEVLERKGLVEQLNVDSTTRYRITKAGTNIATSIIKVWEVIRSK